MLGDLSLILGPHGGVRKIILESRPLTSVCMLWHNSHTTN